MAKLTSSCFFISLICLYVFFTTCQLTQGDWCIAQTTAPDEKLQNFLDTCCAQYNCGDIQPGGSCYDPNTYQNHGSYALDLYYRNTGVCNQEIGTPALTDPSYGSCHYP